MKTSLSLTRSVVGVKCVESRVLGGILDYFREWYFYKILQGWRRNGSGAESIFFAWSQSMLIWVKCVESRALDWTLDYFRGMIFSCNKILQGWRRNSSGSGSIFFTWNQFMGCKTRIQLLDQISQTGKGLNIHQKSENVKYALLLCRFRGISSAGNEYFSSCFLERAQWSINRDYPYLSRYRVQSANGKFFNWYELISEVSGSNVWSFEQFIEYNYRSVIYISVIIPTSPTIA